MSKIKNIMNMRLSCINLLVLHTKWIHIYVLNNPTYTTKTTPLKFKKKKWKRMFIDITLKKKYGVLEELINET